MGFLGVYRAIYDYAPQAEGELAIGEGDVLYILEKNDDDGWWKAKRKAGTDEEDEPEGLIPNNYVEPTAILSHAHAIYEYTRQTDEELSFPEDAVLEIYDTSDPDWILAGLDEEFGFVPSNYIELKPASNEPDSPAPSITSPALPERPQSIDSEPAADSPAASRSTPSAGPAATLAGVMQGRTDVRSATPPSSARSTRQQAPREVRITAPEDQAIDEALQSPALPSRPRPQSITDERSHNIAPIPEPVIREPMNRESRGDEPYRTPGGFHLYNINEMVSVMGKRKKMPTTLGINLKTGIILIAPEHAHDAPAQEWTADKMTHYSREGKHVFMELMRPSKSIDFHAGAKDTAEEIVGALGELAGAIRAEGLKEVMMASSPQGLRKGQVLYDFMAQGDDEVTVAAGDEVVVIDDSKSEEWWQVRRVKNGKEGVVPSSYIEVTGTITPQTAPILPPTESARSTVEQNRLEEIRLTKEAIKASKAHEQQRSRRENGRSEGSKAKSKPDASKIRTWTDRSGSFSVDAQFLGLRDGKIHLHKMNGVKIAVPIAKMSRGDLEYVENATGISLDDDKPLADVKRSKSAEKRATAIGASVGKSEKPEYDWFQFFLSCEVAVGLCERYAQAFIRDSMDESVLPDVNATILRTLGLREGDIIKVMRVLDARFGRDRSKAGTDGDGAGGLFSGPGGALRNNTRKGRPAPAVQTSDTIDATAFSKANATGPELDADGRGSPSMMGSTAKPSRPTAAGGFDDDAWDVKPQAADRPQASKEVKPGISAAETNTASASPAPNITGSMRELSLLTEPLQPAKIEPQSTSAISSSLDAAQPQLAPQPTGASPSFFSNLPNPGQTQPSPQITARQRPAPPSISPSQGSLVPPPPQRPLSAPQSAQQAVFAPPRMSLQPTGAVQGQVAPPGQSLNDLSQMRLQQHMTSMQQLQPALTGYSGMQAQGMAAYPTTTSSPQGYMQPMMTGMPGVSPFADPGRPTQFSPLTVQQTGFQQPYGPGMSSFGQPAPGAGGINGFLPQPLEPQRTGATGFQPQQTGAPGGGVMPPLQPLQPQKTGPPPPVRFGVTTDAKRLTPQPTGRRANLAQATPDNPFGF